VRKAPPSAAVTLTPRGWWTTGWSVAAGAAVVGDGLAATVTGGTGIAGVDSVGAVVGGEGGRDGWAGAVSGTAAAGGSSPGTMTSQPGRIRFGSVRCRPSDCSIGAVAAAISGYRLASPSLVSAMALRVSPGSTT
jgi:hypothetical protein